MSASQAIIDAALALPREERVELIQRLFRTIDYEKDIDWSLFDPDFREALIMECNRRWEEYERGEAAPVPHETVMEEIRTSLKP